MKDPPDRILLLGYFVMPWDSLRCHETHAMPKNTIIFFITPRDHKVQ